MGRFVVPGRPDSDRLRPAVHRTVLVVDVERFGDYHRTNPHRLVVRDGLYRALQTGFTKAGIVWADCHHEDRGDGVLVLIPSEVAKSLLVEYLPRELVASLGEHNSTHGAGEQIRLRMAIHAGEIYYDTHGVVGEAVNHASRLVDSPALKAALAESSGALALVTSNWFFNEVVRHCLTGDPAAYRPVRVAEKETDTVAWICLPDGRYPPAPQAVDSSEQRQHDLPLRSPTVRQGLLWTASDGSARRLGARRTAYPLDLSIAELHGRGLYVPATFSNMTRNVDSLEVDHLVAEIETGSSVLILGEPGSGKSVASYALLDQLRQRIPAIAVRVSELRKALDASIPETDLANALHSVGMNDDLRSVLVIDGLDETLGEFDSSADLSELLRQFSESFSMVVTCRRREFEDNLAHSMESGSFDSIYSIDTWTLEGQFTEFVDRLVASGLLDSNQLLDVIRGSPDLARMVVRPLYARMLTFLGQGGLSAVTNVSSLYAEYIDKLAAASDAALTDAGCRMSVRSSEIWIEAAWVIFSKAMFYEERFSFTAVASLVEEGVDEQLRCLSRALSQICDQWRSRGRAWGSFVHYSFFEYLVSRYYVRQLNQALFDDEATTLMECLSIDPSPEIRHFVVDELRTARVPGLTDALEGAYVRLRATAAGLSRTRTTGNLIAYLLSRAADGGQASLRRLLEGENDMFLQQSILWGLCHLGDSEALAKFVKEARGSAQWRAWNRGYVMYYYGDIDRRAEPPYVDADRRRSWGRTRERSIALMSAASYRTVAAQRRYLDLYLLYDYAVWRGEVLTDEDCGVARDTLEALWNEPTVDGSLLQELQAMHAVVCPSAT